MMKRANFWLGAVLAMGLAAPAVAADVTADTVVATVNGTDITLGALITTAENLPDQYKKLPDDVLYDGILEQLIQQTVLSQSLDGDGPKRVELAVENERRSLRAGVVIDKIASASVTDEALRAAYKDRYANAEPGKEYRASHILVATKEEADAIRKELEDGADFAELAKAKSTGPSGPNGGDLGWFSPGMMVKPFEDAVVKMKPGEISRPVKTQFGWHIIELVETRMKDAPKLDDVRKELETQLQCDAVENAIATMTEAAKITKAEKGSVPPEALRDTGLID